jgi:hypothetical protein
MYLLYSINIWNLTKRSHWTLVARLQVATAVAARLFCRSEVKRDVSSE